MTSIEGRALSVVSKVARAANDPLAEPNDPSRPGRPRVRTAVRALQGMQKEALVESSGAAWRLISDEGHYLNGTDLAPPPLDFFAAGMQFSTLSSVLRAARARAVELTSLSLAQDNVYDIEGSFLRGDARGSARSPVLALSLESDVDRATAVGVVRAGLSASPALALVREPLKNTFSLSVNTRRVPLDGLAALEGATPDRPQFAETSVEDLPSDIIRKISQAERVEGDSHGAGVGLASEQRRTIHVRGNAKWLGDLRFASDVDLVHPIGSSFHFRCDETSDRGGGAGAPPPEVYVVAGVAFCYMTQLGRYAKILDKELAGYEVIQENTFDIQGRPEDDSWAMAARPVATSVFFDCEWEDDFSADVVKTGERTCYLHAAMRGAHPPKVTVELNGEPLTID